MTLSQLNFQWGNFLALDISVPHQKGTFLFMFLFMSCLGTYEVKYANLTWHRIKTNKTMKMAYFCC